MGMYDDILKQMQGSFMQNNPKMFGKPGGFNDNSFGFNNDPDVIKPGGGFGGTTGGTDGNTSGGSTGGTTGGGYGSGGNNQPTGSTTYGGQYQSNFEGSSIDSLLGGIGQSGYNLSDPTSQFGYGDEYSKYFGSFDETGYSNALLSLEARQSSQFSNIGQQYEYGKQGLQGGLGDALMQLRGEESTSGLVGGAASSRRQGTRAAGQQQFQDLGRQTQQRYSGVEDQIAKEQGALEGTLLDFISSQANIALNLELADAPKDSESGPSSWFDIERGNSYSTSSSEMTSFQQRFGDLGTYAGTAYADFVAKAHSNLSESQLNELFNDVYNFYQQQSEGGDV
tara:strand:+ start:5664 stop:6677 length:1014 start_codon:yes stop_codon:yes gene_type:complete